MVVHEQDPHAALIGSAASADKAFMRHEERDDYQAWLWSTVLLIGLLGAALALFVAYPEPPQHLRRCLRRASCWTRR